MKKDKAILDSAYRQNEAELRECSKNLNVQKALLIKCNEDSAQREEEREGVIKQVRVKLQVEESVALVCNQKLEKAGKKEQESLKKAKKDCDFRVLQQETNNLKLIQKLTQTEANFKKLTTQSEK